MIATIARSIALKLVCIIVLVAMLIVPVGAQGNISLNIDGLQSLSGQTMQALVTVRDENGVPIPGLGPANFAIVEDQKTFFPPEAVTTRVNPEARLSVALVIDLSSNMRGQPLVEAKAASLKLLETLLSQPSDTDRAAFFGINGPVDLNNLTVRADNIEVDFTNDRNAILNTIDLSPHDCRHTWATLASRAHTPLERLMDAGGWASYAMPLRYIQTNDIANDGVTLTDSDPHGV